MRSCAWAPLCHRPQSLQVRLPQSTHTMKVPTAGTSEQGITAGLLSHARAILQSTERAHLSARGRGTAMQPGRVAHTGAKHGDAQAGAWEGLAGWSKEREEAPPLAVRVLLASAGSDLSPVGVRRGGSGTYTVSPSERPPLPPPRLGPLEELGSSLFWSQKSLSMEARGMDLGRIIRSPAPSPIPNTTVPHTRVIRHRHSRGAAGLGERRQRL